MKSLDPIHEQHTQEICAHVRAQFLGYFIINFKNNIIMRKVLLALLPFLMLCACGEKKSPPEEDARNYGKYFVEKLKTNQLDSLKASYPAIMEAESIVPFESDTIIVTETTPGQFDLTLAEGVMLKVNHSEDGNFTVTESKGLFSFPPDKVELAKKTGMWDENLSDVALLERLSDDDFFTYLKKNKTVNPNNIIALGKVVNGSYASPGYALIENKTDQPIKGSDYKVIFSEVYFEGMMPFETTKTKAGKDIKPHGSVKYEIMTYNRGGEEIKGVKLNLSPEQINERFLTYTGTEYQDYLNSKK